VAQEAVEAALPQAQQVQVAKVIPAAQATQPQPEEAVERAQSVLTALEAEMVGLEVTAPQAPSLALLSLMPVGAEVVATAQAEDRALAEGALVALLLALVQRVLTH
jgi:hypothetical protein